MASISDNIYNVKARIEHAAKRVGRDPSEIKLVAATKGVPAELIVEAIKAGITDIGENRVQEAEIKFEALKSYPVTRHMIGHLQTNKVRQAIKLFSVIQSVDSEHLALEVSKRSDKPIDVLIEVNTSGEASKFGVPPDRALKLAKYISDLDNLKLTGLMTIGPLTENVGRTRESFRLLKKLFEQIKELNLPRVLLKYLSMGMSGDYEIAIEEGSNLVRIGTAIFKIEHGKRG